MAGKAKRPSTPKSFGVSWRWWCISGSTAITNGLRLTSIRTRSIREIGRARVFRHKPWPKHTGWRTMWTHMPSGLLLRGTRAAKTASPPKHRHRLQSRDQMPDTNCSFLILGLERQYGHP